MMKKLVGTVFSAAVLCMAAPVVQADGAALYAKCVQCHGEQAEKAAMGKSEVIKGWPADKTVAALKGYKDGSYGGAMKGLMTAQVSTLDDAAMQSVAEYIAGL
ncbi:MAG: c-type cytochrome [Amphritea sp.]|nr:c-type cytochrome [Amphritea sp.]